MRLLIGLYLAFGVAHWAMSVVIGFLGVRSLTTGGAGPRRGGPPGEEALTVAAVAWLVGCLPLLAAYGLWRRWPVARLVLLVLSWGAAVAAVLVGGAAVAGLTDGRDPVFNEPPLETFAAALGLLAFAAWQVWVLTRPSVRDSFRRAAITSGE